METAVPPVDGVVKIDTTSDKMEADITVTPASGEGSPVLPAGVIRRLQDAGIVHGIDEAAVEAIVRQCNETGEQQSGMVARGTYPKPGTAARLEVLVSPPPRPDHPETGEGSQEHIDYHFPMPIISVHAGQEVARKTKATSGVCGTNVLGKDVAPQVGDDKCAKGTFRIRVEEDANTVRYFATEDGEFVQDAANNSFCVSAEHMVAGDVTVATGDVVFVRDVVVKGNLSEGAMIRAGGSVQVMGRAEAGFIHAQGDVTISQGIVAGGRGLIESAHNVEAAFAEGAVIRAGGDVTIRKGVLNSDISARGSVFCTQGRGSIMGGVTRAVKLVEVKRLGSGAGGETLIIVGVDFIVLERRDQVRQQMDHVTETLERFNRALGPVAAGDDLSRFPSEMQGNIRTAVEQREALKQQLETLKEDFAQAQAALNASREGAVRVMGEAYPGTKIRIRDTAVVLTDFSKYCTLTEDHEEGTIKVGPLT
jgi:hypothetical protein